MKPICFSIGHSNYCFTQFRDLLLFFGITLVVDVRAIPYSRFVPHFNREELRDRLHRDGIKYMYAGKEMGGRGRGTAGLDEVVHSQGFQAGIDRVMDKISAGEIAAVMCAEKDPFDCHRFFLVSYALEARGIEVRHILESGNSVPTGILEERLVETYHDGLFQLSLFGESDVQADAVQRAYSHRFREAAGEIC